MKVTQVFILMTVTNELLKPGIWNI